MNKSENGGDNMKVKMFRQHSFICRTAHGASVVVKAPDGDVARYRAERAGFRISKVEALRK